MADLASRQLDLEAEGDANPRNNVNAESEGSASTENDYLRLRLAGSLSKFRRIDTSARIVEEEPFEPCPLPSTFQTCRESRAHTLTHFMLLEDSQIESHSFYLNPSYDVVWLSMDVTDDGYEKVSLLRQTYGHQLDRLHNILVHESDWDEWGGFKYCETFFGIFGGLKLVIILLQDHELNEDSIVVGKTRDLHSRSKELKEADLTIAGSGIFKGLVRYVGCDGTIYGELWCSPDTLHGSIPNA